MILIISPTYGIDTGGNGKSAVLLFSRLRKLGQKVKVCVVNSSHGLNYELDHIDHINCKDRNPFVLIKLYSYLKKHRNKVDKVVIMNGWLIFAALLPCRFFGLDIFYWGNNFKPFCANTAYYAENMCESCTLLRRTRCTTVRRALAYSIIQMFLRIKEIIFLSFSETSDRLAKLNARISIVYRITNLKEFEKDRRLIKNKRRQILVIGTFEVAKGSHSVVNFYDSFLADRDDFELLVIGRVIDTTAYNELSVRRNVYFLGEINNTEVKDYINSSLILLHLPAYLEPFARVWLEAASKSCVIISSEIPSAREILGDNALYYPSNSKEINSALDNVNILNSYSKRSRFWYDSLNLDLGPLIQS